METGAPELGPECFLLARQAERACRSEQRRRRKAKALTALHAARDAFRDHGGPVADRDSDVLEALADRLVDWVQTLERDFDRLDLARDQTRRRGLILTRLRTPFEAGALAQALAETLGEFALSDQAGAVLAAAVEHAAA